MCRRALIACLLAGLMVASPLARGDDEPKEIKPSGAASTAARPSVVHGQPVPTGSVTPGKVAPAQGTAHSSGSPASHPSVKPSASAGEKPPGADAAKKSGTSQPEPVKATRRPAKPPVPPDPAEFEARPDERGVIRFQFRGQPWPDVLEWLAQISGMSIDWQELPGDYINLSTQRGYTVAEVSDLLNRLLLARGYTMLQQDESLVVVKCADLSAAIVPRVAASDLAQRPAHQFVRVQFPLHRLLARDIAEELKPLSSKNGKLTALKATNRLEVMDAVANALEIQRLLDEEDSDDGEVSRSVREFVLRYARAEDVRKSLAEFIGATLSATPATGRAMSPQQLAQQQAMMRAQMQAAQRAQQSKKTAVAPKPKVEPVRMMVNRNRNSILVQAPPDKMAVIAEAIKLIDVPREGAQSLQAILGRMKVYRLAQLDPRKLVATLNEVGGLDPTTRLEADDVNKAIIAYATPADHFTIQSTIEKLDSSARKIEVIPLRRLAADEVAGTIQYLMVGQKAEKKPSRSSYYGGYYPYDYGRRSSTTAGSKDEFRVEADVENNRLLVRANDMELEEVVSILVKLGEIPRADSAQGATRILDIAPDEKLDAFLEQLERRWKRVAPNQLILPEHQPPATEPETPSTETEQTRPAKSDREPPHAEADVQLTMAEVDTASPPVAPDRQPATTPAPIVIAVNQDGQLVISSRDVEALDLLETLAAQLAPPRKDYKVYHLRYASATWIELNLEEFFKEDESADNSGATRFYSMYYGMPPASSSETPQHRLSKRRSLTFISDIDTNTLIVKNADARQLKIIDDLIEVYDAPEPLSSQTARMTRLFPIRYSKAATIADTIKDAYRDLLSSNDKAFRQQGNKPQGQRYASGISYLSPFGGTSASKDRTQTQVRFKGKLSIGIDEISNTLLVTTEGEALMQVIEKMIDELDKAAEPVSEMRVLKVGSGADWSRLQETMARVVGQQNGPSTRSTASKRPPATRRPATRSSKTRNRAAKR